MESLGKLARKIEDVARQVALLRKVLMRMGTVQLVDSTACTVVVQFSGDDASGAPSKSLPIPWLQRSTEHRPPAVGDHAIVLDPSLGNGAAVAIIGWPSTSRPAPHDGAPHAEKHALYSGAAPAKIVSSTIELGTSPSDYAALASKVDAELSRIWETLVHADVVPAGTEAGLAALKTKAGQAKLLKESVTATQVKIK